MFIEHYATDLMQVECQGTQCFVACSCNTSNGWYDTPEGAKDGDTNAQVYSITSTKHRSVSSVLSLGTSSINDATADALTIGTSSMKNQTPIKASTRSDLAIDAPTIQTASASADDYLTCYKKIPCPDGYFPTVPTSAQREAMDFDEDTSTGITCYKPTCKDGYAPLENSDYYLGVTYENYTCNQSDLPDTLTIRMYSKGTGTNTGDFKFFPAYDLECSSDTCMKKADGSDIKFTIDLYSYWVSFQYGITGYGTVDTFYHEDSDVSSNYITINGRPDMGITNYFTYLKNNRPATIGCYETLSYPVSWESNNGTQTATANVKLIFEYDFLNDGINYPINICEDCIDGYYITEPTAAEEEAMKFYVLSSSTRPGFKCYKAYDCEDGYTDDPSLKKEGGDSYEYGQLTCYEKRVDIEEIEFYVDVYNSDCLYYLDYNIIDSDDDEAYNGDVEGKTATLEIKCGSTTETYTTTVYYDEPSTGHFEYRCSQGNATLESITIGGQTYKDGDIMTVKVDDEGTYSIPVRLGIKNTDTCMGCPSGYYTTSPNTDFFTTSKSGSLCYKADGCVENPDSSWFGRVSSQASGLTCYRSTSCIPGVSVENSPSTVYFTTSKSTSATGIVCYKATGCSSKTTASNTNTMFNYVKNTETGKTCYQATSCNASAYAYSSEPNATYFTYSTSTISGIKCHQATGCKSGYSSSGSGEGATYGNKKCYKEDNYFNLSVETVGCTSGGWAFNINNSWVSSSLTDLDASKSYDICIARAILDSGELYFVAKQDGVYGGTTASILDHLLCPYSSTDSAKSKCTDTANTYSLNVTYKSGEVGNNGYYGTVCWYGQSFTKGKSYKLKAYCQTTGFTN